MGAQPLRRPGGPRRGGLPQGVQRGRLPAHPGAVTVAEESTAWPAVSRPTYLGGLGFGFKWNMGWMHDTLEYFSKEPVHRRYHHNDLTFGLLYAWHENFILPISHDEVTHGKGSLSARCPGTVGSSWPTCGPC